jgi:radical SAM protein with 4Fe4S-binding SPASM domain
MLDITKILSNQIEKDSIRYSDECAHTNIGTKKGVGPVIVWNITNKCNYKCKHCYSDSTYSNEASILTLEEIKKIIYDLKLMNVPVILLSGGEPLMRKDIFEIIKIIKDNGIRVSLSSNGSLIDENKALKLKELGVSYVGISIDGKEETNDSFRGIKGAFKKSLKAIENCNNVGLKVGLRFTLQKNNYNEVNYILNLMEKINVNRICFYHLVPSGRGKNIADKILSHEETRGILDLLYDYSEKSILKKEKKEILTVTNHADGPYIYLKTKEKNPDKAERILSHLMNNRGNRSGIAIANIDWEGNVYPDQFSKFLKLGNLKNQSFIDIWTGKNLELEQFRNRKSNLKGRCEKCKWLNICNGNLRARAYNINNDIWASDPACYLGDDEI